MENKKNYTGFTWFRSSLDVQINVYTAKTSELLEFREVVTFHPKNKRLNYTDVVRQLLFYN